MSIPLNSLFAYRIAIPKLGTVSYCSQKFEIQPRESRTTRLLVISGYFSHDMAYCVFDSNMYGDSNA